MNNLPVAQESFIYIVLFALLSAALYLWIPPLPAVTLLLLAFVVFFFRNPHRAVPEEENTAAAPADGRTLSITQIDETAFLKPKTSNITIFLSIFSAYFHRSPMDGTVAYTACRPGKLLPAHKSLASEWNERNTLRIEGKKTKVVVHPIARRIVCWAKKGTRFRAGERFDLIKSGSCTEARLPINAAIKVKVGNKVKDAKTVIGVIN